MNIQIFGTSKCFDTKKAQRYFKERGIKFQMIDLKEKGMSRGEFDNVARALGGWEALVNPAAKDKQTLALLDALVDWQKEDKLFENQQLFKTPTVRTDTLSRRTPTLSTLSAGPISSRIFLSSRLAVAAERIVRRRFIVRRSLSPSSLTMLSRRIVWSESCSPARLRNESI